MNLNIKKKLVFLLGLFLAISGLTGTTSNCFAQNSSINSSNEVNKSRFQTLSKKPAWQKLCNIWQEMNHFEKSDGPAGPDIKHYDKIKNMLAKVPELLNKLVEDNSISVEEEAFLNDTFNYRLDFLAFENQIVTCYSMTEDAYEFLKKRGDLELQFDILEKLFNENKISSDAFETSRKTIIEDLKWIDKKYPKDDKPYTSANLSDLIIYLNE